MTNYGAPDRGIRDRRLITYVTSKMKEDLSSVARDMGVTSSVLTVIALSEFLNRHRENGNLGETQVAVCKDHPQDAGGKSLQMGEAETLVPLRRRNGVILRP